MTFGLTDLEKKKRSIFRMLASSIQYNTAIFSKVYMQHCHLGSEVTLLVIRCFDNESWQFVCTIFYTQIYCYLSKATTKYVKYILVDISSNQIIFIFMLRHGCRSELFIRMTHVLNVPNISLKLVIIPLN